MWIDPWGLVEVGLREYAATYEGAVVGWDSATRIATVTWQGRTLSVASTDYNIRAGRVYVDDLVFVNFFGNGPNAITVYQDSVTFNVSIRANVSTTGTAANLVIPGTSITYRQATIDGITLLWSGPFGMYDVSTYVTDYRGMSPTTARGAFNSVVSIDIRNSLGISHMNGSASWSPTKTGSIIMFVGDSRGAGAAYLAADYQWVAAHEFFHTLGVGDLYNTGIPIQTTSISSRFGTAVSENDIRLVLRAWNVGQWQNWGR